MAHRENIKDMLHGIDVQDKMIIDWGCGTKKVTKYTKGNPLEYFSIDKLDHVSADMVADISDYVVLERAYDIAFCMEVLEHVKYPHMVFQNIFLNLKKGGELYMSVPFLFPVHSQEDYWRFTDQGLKFLTENAGFKIDFIRPTDDNQGWLMHAFKE